jgi:hypothetical protein
MLHNTSAATRNGHRRGQAATATALTAISTVAVGALLSSPASASVWKSHAPHTTASVKAPAAKSNPTKPTLASSQIFGPTSVWRTLVTTAPVASNSAAEVATLANEAASLYGGIAAFNVWDYNASIYTAAAGTARVNVQWNNCQGKSYTPAGLVGANGQFTGVPIPANAVPASGTDAELTIYSPSTDQLWEFWEAKHTATGWQACWGGRIDHVSTSAGYFLNGFGASASGLAVAGGAITIADVKSGSINHALELQITAPAMWNKISWPAQRSDGSNASAGAIPEGTRLRLNPTINVDSLPLTPIAKMIAKAAQTYGFIVTDMAGAVSVVAESGVPYAGTTGVNPWTALLGSTPSYKIMQNFPWGSLQAMPQDYGKPAA